MNDRKIDYRIKRIKKIDIPLNEEIDYKWNCDNFI
jgi:hypothetical protein